MMTPADRTNDAKVLPFRPRAGGQTSASSHIQGDDDGVRGTILFFTGVRYERHEQTQKQDKRTRCAAPRSSRKRG